MALYTDILGEVKDNDRTSNTLKDEVPANWMSERKSAIQKSFELALGKQAAKAYTVQSTGRNNKLSYYIALSEDQVIFQ